MGNLRLICDTIPEEGRKNQTTTCKEQKQISNSGEIVFKKQMKDAPDANSNPSHSSELSPQNMRCQHLCGSIDGQSLTNMALG